MKPWSLFALCVVCLAMVPPCSGGEARMNSADGWGQIGSYGSHYDPCTEHAFRGEVVEVTHSRSSTLGADVNVVLRVWTPRDGEQFVFLGSATYLDRHGFRIGTGDTISVAGSRVRILGRDLTLARDLTRGGERLALLNEKGGHL